MLIIIVCNLLLFFVVVTTIQIPFIDNAIFIALSNSSDTIIINQTCNQCLCMSNVSNLALNCFPNDTCQFFNIFPRTYKIQSISQARLYFLQQIFPNESQCCMPNTSYLLDKLNTTHSISTYVPAPRCIVFDNHGYLVTISQTNFTIFRFYPTNLTVVDQPISPKFNNTPMTISYYNETYHVGFDYFILVISSNDLTIVNNITSSVLNGTRDMMFINNGQTMVVASTYDKNLLFFDRNTNYTFINKQFVNYSYPHGLRYINDSYFYVTSWSDNTIYSYSADNSNIIWTQNFFLNAKPVAPSSDGNHVIIDECDRYWFLLGDNGIRIFNNQGLYLENVTQFSSVFDAVIRDNYVVYLSDASSSQIRRIDPNIQC